MLLGRVGTTGPEFKSWFPAFENRESWASLFRGAQAYGLKVGQPANCKEGKKTFVCISLF